jgi:hypothetical protein
MLALTDHIYGKNDQRMLFGVWSAKVWSATALSIPTL